MKGVPQDVASRMDLIRFIDYEIELLKQFIEPTETGHIHTTISTLKWHQELLRQSLPPPSQNSL